MITKLRTIFLSFMGAMVLVGSGSAAVYAIDCAKPATAKEAIQCGVDGASGTTQTPQEATKEVDELITKVLNIISVIAGIIAVVMVVFGGLRFITSGGSEEKVKSAKKTLAYAVVGLVVVALAQVIVQFVLKKATQKPPPTTTSSISIMIDTGIKLV